jgi:LmbE family N-acetylglucosaminyl deacetylase
VPKPLTLMAVHAHPDDEASSTGGVLAHYGARGVRTIVVTCTNGEYGDGPGGIKPGEPGHDENAVAATRLAELDAACAILGVTHLERLGYHDSGMADWPYHERPDVFANVPVDDAAERLVKLFDEYEPDVIVTYDDRGGYNHPDHIQAHRITVAAVDGAERQGKLYFTARRRRDWERMRARMIELGVELPTPPRLDPERLRMMDEMESRITTNVDTTDVADRKRAALMAHASQIAESWFGKIPADLFGEVFGHESFIRVKDSTGASVPEIDLLAGLR